MDKYLLSKYEDWSLDHQNPHKTNCTWCTLVDPACRRYRTSQTIWKVLGTARDLASMSKVESNWRRQQCRSLASICALALLHTCTPYTANMHSQACTPHTHTHPKRARISQTVQYSLYCNLPPLHFLVTLLTTMTAV